MNSTDPDPVVTLKARIASLAPLVAGFREAIDRERRLPRRVFDALAEAGLLRLWAPRKFGGWELSLIEFMEVVEAAAALDGSIGWIVGNGGGMSRAAGYLSEDFARAYLAEPNAMIVASTGAIGEAVPVEGGYRVSGRWPFASGIHHASLVAAASRIVDPNGQGAVLLCYVPVKQVEVIDTWHVSGLRGSGSCDFTLHDIFVPTENTHDMYAPSATQSGCVYSLPHVSVFATTVGVVPLGIARATLDTFVGTIASRSKTGTSSSLRERELIQSELGRAETLHASGRSLLISAMRELEAATNLGGDRLVLARAMYRAACTYAAETAIRIAGMVGAAAGSASIFESHLLERQIRDIQAAAKHVAMSPNNYVVAGRILFGLDPGTTRF